MTRIPRLQQQKTKIDHFFEGLPKKVFKRQDLTGILAEHHGEWKLPVGLTFTKFLEFLLSKTNLREIILPSENYSNEKRFVWGSPSVYSMALSLRKNSYLSHGSAVFLHNLTDQIPKRVYVNHEQSPKPGSGTLAQEGIDRAFSNSERQSNLTYEYEEFLIVIVSGKSTNRLEVTAGFGSEALEVTKLERTLIDIVVRPTYAGGVFQVLEAFKRAKKQISVNTLVATLQKLDYLYPYQQAIGFYMEKAGYQERDWSKLLRLGSSFDFYLAHRLPEDKKYDSKWRLYYPVGF